MNKKSIAITVELIPVISTVLYFLLVFSKFDSQLIRKAVYVTFFPALFGFAFFFIGRKIGKDYKTVRILGILDWLSTLSVIGLFILGAYAAAL